MADLSVVICSLNGAPGVDRCLRALAAQADAPRMQAIVVDDGSTDATSDVARAHGAVLVRHPTNRGLAAARNSGVRAATAPVVAFLDDDCEPAPGWAAGLLAGYLPGVLGVGGPVLPQAPEGFMAGYLRRHNPLQPLEIELARSHSLPYRFYLYLRRQWAHRRPAGMRDVYSLVGANMSFRREALLEVGLFDERFRFGAEEVDLCQRLARDLPSGRLLLAPDASVTHHFVPTLRDTLRRSRAYGRGSARLYRKWPSALPAIFPGPLAVLALLVLGVRFPALLGVAVLLPYLLYPRAVREALGSRRFTCALDPFVQLAQEASENLGFLRGLWQFRGLVPETAPAGAASANREAASAVAEPEGLSWP